jgi:hypothetical protein
MKVGDVVETPNGLGRIVDGTAWRKPTRRSRTGHWVFLFNPPVMANRVICYSEGEVRAHRHTWRVVRRERNTGHAMVRVCDKCGRVERHVRGRWVEAGAEHVTWRRR